MLNLVILETKHGGNRCFKVCDRGIMTGSYCLAVAFSYSEARILKV
jgi:hypothetical protein